MHAACKHTHAHARAHTPDAAVGFTTAEGAGVMRLEEYWAELSPV